MGEVPALSAEDIAAIREQTRQSFFSPSYSLLADGVELILTARL